VKRMTYVTNMQHYLDLNHGVPEDIPGPALSCTTRIRPRRPPDSRQKPPTGSKTQKSAGITSSRLAIRSRRMPADPLILRTCSGLEGL